MNSRLPQRRTVVRLLLTLALLALPAWSAPAGDGAATLRAVVILSRHGVRAPIDAPAKLAPYSAQPWPAWDVPPGCLTPRGKRLMALMGAYYRTRYVADELLTGDPSVDRGRIFFRTNNIERTQETGRGLALGLLDERNPELHVVPEGTVDVMFTPARVRYGSPDDALAVAAVRARLGADPDAFVRTYRSQFRRLHGILFGRESDALPPGKIRLLDLPTTIRPGEKNTLVECSGPLNLAKTFAENFMLEYAEGMPAAEVGWGRADRESLADLVQLHALDFDLTQRTFYVAQVQVSDLADHILQTLEQAAAGRARPGAIGPASARLIVIVGHDTNLSNLAGLLNLSWSVDSLPMNPTLPGGALVFELWRHADARFFVRTYYMTQTLEQMHTAVALTLSSPPAIAPVFVPACSTSGTDYEAPFEALAARLRQVIDPRFVAPQS